MSDETSQAISSRETRGLFMASAVIGIASGVLLVVILRRLERLPPFMPMPPVGRWYFDGYELLVALLGAMGVCLFCPRRGRINGLVGAGAALVAMLLADTFRAMSYLPPVEWGEAPTWIRRMFAWGRWPKVLRYAFGVYLAGYLCSGGPAPTGTTKDEQ